MEDTDSENDDDLFDKMSNFINENAKINEELLTDSDNNILYDTPRGYLDINTGFIYCKETWKLIAL